MAQKKITDLQLADNFSVDLSLPADDGIQTYRTTGQQIADLLSAFYQKNQGLVKNVGLSCVASAGAMTVALKQSDGSTDPTTGLSKTEIVFRSPTITSGAQVRVEFTAALNIVIPSGATFGYANGDYARVFVYAYWDGTNKGLMCSPLRLNEEKLYAFTAIGTGSDSATGMYADAIRSGAAVRLIGHFQVDAISTAGTWTTASSVTLMANQIIPHGLIGVQTFVNGGGTTYTKNPDAKNILIIGTGGGAAGGRAPATGSGESSGGPGGSAGGTFIAWLDNRSVPSTVTVAVGAAGAGTTSPTAGSGGSTTWGSLYTATGGVGGTSVATGSSSSGQSAGAAGAGSGGLINIDGGRGGQAQRFATNVGIIGGHGGGSFWGSGGGVSASGGTNTGGNGTAGTAYGSGGGGASQGQNQSTIAGSSGAPGILVVFEFA
jgi:hypothetical protein